MFSYARFSYIATSEYCDYSTQLNFISDIHWMGLTKANSTMSHGDQVDLLLRLPQGKPLGMPPIVRSVSCIWWGSSTFGITHLILDHTTKHPRCIVALWTCFQRWFESAELGDFRNVFGRARVSRTRIFFTTPRRQGSTWYITWQATGVEASWFFWCISMPLVDR